MTFPQNQKTLDKPVWYALSDRQRAFAEGSKLALRFAADVEPFAASRNDSPEALQALVQLIGPGGHIALMQREASPAPKGTKIVMSLPGVQMIAETVSPLMPSAPIVPLTEADAPAMLALADLTKPGPFLPRTHLLGQFWGVKEGGRLIAMAGERMKLPGYTEVSGVCTHPDARGRGLAAQLSRVVATNISNRGETPFLHAVATNTTAIELYKRLGFVTRCEIIVTVLMRDNDGA